MRRKSSKQTKQAKEAKQKAHVTATQGAKKRLLNEAVTKRR